MNKSLAKLLLILIFLLSACGVNNQSTSTTKSNDDPQTLLQQEENITEWNKLIKIGLALTKGNNQVEPKPDTIIEIYIENLSDKETWFPLHDKFRFFEFNENEGKWLEIDNRMTYYGYNTVLNPKGKGVFSTIKSVMPKVSDTKATTSIRIFVIGNVSNDGKPTDEKVGAYFDVTIKP